MNDSKMVNELKSCPFCGGTDVSSTHRHWQIECNTCAANGPWNGEFDENKAISDWNTRAAPAEGVRAVDEPVGYAQTRDLEKIGGRNVIHVGVLMSPKTQDGFEPIYRHAQRQMLMPEEATRRTSSDADEAYDSGWNACLDELKRLNP
ncbi:Lar family restriction alleviation protein [Pseudomonas sp.]|uniref:Lar family restriction alleviation protein n=1 Tax=Pseudomonas sp. TaxID=306 RepID=UPI003FD6C686